MPSTYLFAMRTGEGEGTPRPSHKAGQGLGSKPTCPAGAHSSRLYAAASKQPSKSASGCLVNKAHAIAVREPNPQGEGERNTANRWESCRRRLTEGVVSISQGPGRREMEYTTPVIAAQKASPQGDAAWLAANH